MKVDKSNCILTLFNPKGEITLDIPKFVCEMEVVNGVIINLIYMPNWWNRFWMKRIFGFKFRHLK